MIEQFAGMYSLICDVCGEEAEETFWDFHEAVEYKRANGWKSQRRYGEWEVQSNSRAVVDYLGTVDRLIKEGEM